MNKTITEIAESILMRSLKPEDGMFVSAIEEVENRLNVNIPILLKQFYLSVGNLEMFMNSFESFTEPYIVDDKLVFLEENQGVCFWGIKISDLNNDNQEVFMCTDIEQENTEWFSENVLLTEFLKILMYYQMAQGGYEYGNAIYENSYNSRNEYLAHIDRIVKNWDKVVEHNGLVIYQQQDKLIWYFTNKKGAIENIIYASTLTEQSSNQLAEYGFSEL